MIPTAPPDNLEQPSAGGRGRHSCEPKTRATPRSDGQSDWQRQVGLRYRSREGRASGSNGGRELASELEIWDAKRRRPARVPCSG